MIINLCDLLTPFPSCHLTTVFFFFVRKRTLPGVSSAGTLSTVIGELRALTHLFVFSVFVLTPRLTSCWCLLNRSLVGGKVSGTLPTQLGNLVALKFLYMHGCVFGRLLIRLLSTQGSEQQSDQRFNPVAIGSTDSSRLFVR